MWPVCNKGITQFYLPPPAKAVELFTWTASASGHHLRTIQTVVENVYV